MQGIGQAVLPNLSQQGARANAELLGGLLAVAAGFEEALLDGVAF